MLVGSLAVIISLIVVNVYWVLTLYQAQASGVANSSIWDGRAGKVTEQGKPGRDAAGLEGQGSG